MKPAEIIAMAREAGFDMSNLPSIRASNVYGEVNDELEHFAALVAAKAAADERAACAQVCDEMRAHYSDYKDTALLNGDVALSNAASGEPRACEFLAAAIRARGVQP